MLTWKNKANKLIIIAVAAAMLVGTVPTSAWATVEGDQTPLSDEEIQDAIDSGEIDATVDEPTTFVLGTDAPVSSDFADSYEGDTRFDTAAMQARAAYDRSEYVIVVGDGGWPDALAATGLAGILDCPILLTARDGLSSQARSAISDLGASRAVVLGGPIVISDRVVTDLRGMGLAVDRLAGDTRRDTQMMVYEYGASHGGWSTDVVAFASGERFHDALSFAPVAYALRVPVFLVDESGSLEPEQRAALQGKRFATPVVLGGPIVMGDSTVAFANSIAASGSCTRLAGDTRYDTSADVAQWSVDKLGFSWDGAAFTTASLPYDALAGGVLQGKQRSVILLVDDAGNPSVTRAVANRGAIKRIKFFGGVMSVSNVDRMSIVSQLGRPYSSVPGYKVYIDAGHGWNDSNNGQYDSGACANGYQEAQLTAELATEVSRILNNKYGIATYLNTDGGWYKLRNAEASAQGCMSLVSIHFNSGGGTGSESYRHSYNAAKNSYQIQMAAHNGLISGIGLTNRGMKTEAFAVCGGSVPAVLLEVCFIDNSSDMNRYLSRKSAVAEQIAAGIANAR